MSLLAHDLRNPLSAVLTNINFVRSAMRTRAPDIDEALSDSALSCAMLGQVIGNLDVLARTLSTATLARQPTVSRRIADDAVARFGPQAAIANLRFEVHELRQAPVLVVEPTFFARALDNLVANAIQYAPSGGAIRIECVEAGDRGKLVLLDEGPTIPADIRELALSGDWQGQAKQRYEARYGRGLGLYCAAQAARIAGAELTIADRDGRSAFELSAALAAR
jgi:K+-sensing histidine kinase KdpD